jgi:DNA-binding transcriptional LysR family regulator
MVHSSALPPLDALQAVLAAQRGGSFSAAAAALGITHGAVSRRVAAVERWHGAPLFERHGRGVRLSVEGQRFVALVERALAMLAETAGTRGRRGPEAVRISVVPSFARLWLLPRLKRLEGDPPDLRIEIEQEQRFADLGRVDLALRYGRGNWEGVVAEPLFDETLIPVATPEIAARLGQAPSPDRLLALPLIHEAYEDGWRTWLASHGRPLPARPQDRRLEDHDLVLQAAALGLGIALLRRPYGEARLADGRLVALYDAGPPNHLRFHLVTRPGRRRPAVERLIRRMREAV